jgi:rare lipoprotein A
VFPVHRTIVVVLCLLLALVTLLSATVVAGRRVFKGQAVYYADRYEGQTMACGGRYRRRKMIAAHRKLPCGTKLEVTNRSNGRTVIVKVKDRGPYGDANTILDLSRRAAKKLRYVGAGRARVRAVIVH